jgi:hypothetical protein
MKVVFVRPLRLQYHINDLCHEFDVKDSPDAMSVLTKAFRNEIEKPVEEMSPVFLDLLEVLLETLLSYGVTLDFFSMAEIEPADECNSILIKVLP